MTQTIVLAPTTAAAQSSDFTQSGTPISVAIYSTDTVVAGALPLGQLTLLRKIGSSYYPACRSAGTPIFLGDMQRDYAIIDPGTYAVSKPATPHAVGVSVDDVAGSAPTTSSNISQVGGSNLALGQKTMAASLPVAIASDQTALPNNLTEVNGAALSLGQKTTAQSLPVTLPSDLTFLPVRNSVPNADYHYGTSTQTITLNPSSSGFNLRKLVVGITTDATQTTAGRILLTVTVGNVAVYQTNIWVASTPTGALGINIIANLDFGLLGIPAGTYPVVVSLANALTAGLIEANAYLTAP